MSSRDRTSEDGYRATPRACVASMNVNVAQVDIARRDQHSAPVVGFAPFEPEGIEHHAPGDGNRNPDRAVATAAHDTGQLTAPRRVTGCVIDSGPGYRPGATSITAPGGTVAKNALSAPPLSSVYRTTLPPRWHDWSAGSIPTPTRPSDPKRRRSASQNRFSSQKRMDEEPAFDAARHHHQPSAPTTRHASFRASPRERPHPRSIHPRPAPRGPRPWPDLSNQRLGPPSSDGEPAARPPFPPDSAGGDDALGVGTPTGDCAFSGRTILMATHAPFGRRSSTKPTPATYVRTA